VADPDPAAAPPRGELESGQDIDGAEVGVDQFARVADDQLHVGAFEQETDKLAERAYVGAGDRTIDNHDDRGRLGRRPKGPLGIGQQDLLVAPPKDRTELAAGTHRDQYGVTVSSYDWVPKKERRAR
jgi:hypothetical protein